MRWFTYIEPGWLSMTSPQWLNIFFTCISGSNLPPKFHIIDTKNDGKMKCISGLKTWPYFGACIYFVKFPGGEYIYIYISRVSVTSSQNDEASEAAEEALRLAREVDDELLIMHAMQAGDGISWRRIKGALNHWMPTIQNLMKANQGGHANHWMPRIQGWL